MLSGECFGERVIEIVEHRKLRLVVFNVLVFNEQLVGNVGAKIVGKREKIGYLVLYVLILGIPF